MNKSTLSGDIGCTKKGKEWAWIALPNELPGYIFFIPSFSSSSSPSLGKGDREMFDQRARKDLKKCISLSIYHVLVS